MTLLELKIRLPYNPKLKDRAKELRKNMTKTEQIIWFKVLKSLQEIYNFRVLRQRPILNFIVDFYIPQLFLVIEIDWDTHFTDEAKWYDDERTIELNKLWLQVIRYTNNEVLENIDWVYEDLKNKINNLQK